MPLRPDRQRGGVESRVASIPGALTWSNAVPPSRRYALLAVVLLGLALEAPAQPAAKPAAKPAAVADSELTRTVSALARLDDVDTLLSLTSEGALLYQQDAIKLDGYQYCSQAVALAERGELRRSVQAASKAMHVALQTGNGDLLGKAYRDFAITFSYAGRLDRAEAFAKLALEHPAKDPQQTAGPAHKTVGDVRVRQQRYPEAIASYETALETSSARFRPLVQASLANALILSKDLPRARTVLDGIEPPDDPIRRGQLQRTRGRLLLAENRFDEALALFQQELATADSIAEDAGFYRLWALDGISRSQAALGKPTEAAQSLDQALASFDQVRARFRSEEFKMGLFSDLQAIFERAIVLYTDLNQAPRAFDISERSRARALLDAVSERGDVSAEASEAMAIADLQSQLRADESVVAYHSLPDRLLVWTVDREHVREQSLPMPGADLVQLVDAWRTALTQGDPAAVGAGEQIGALLIAPLGLDQGRRLIIVPHGALHYLPFQALRVEGEYLIQRHPIAIAPSTSIAVKLAARTPTTPPQLVAFGNPDVGPEYALPGSEQEVKQLAELFPGAAVYLDAEASKTRFRKAATQARLLHVAAHAQADRVDPLYSRILLANEDGKQNFLEAHEVLALDLDKVALVTLSACESGLGRVADGDEVLGFPRAFLSAGTSGLVVSLWPVADDATALLMTTLYAELAKGTDLMRAMQRAQLAVLEQPGMAHPFFWAPFDVIGNWRLTVGG